MTEVAWQPPLAHADAGPELPAESRAPVVVSTAPVDARFAAALVGSGLRIDELRSQGRAKTARVGSETFRPRAGRAVASPAPALTSPFARLRRSSALSRWV